MKRSREQPGGSRTIGGLGRQETVGAGGRDSMHAPSFVGIGASAGGLEALEVLFQKMPPNSGLAFVVVQGHTALPVSRIRDGVVDGSVITFPDITELRLQAAELQACKTRLLELTANTESKKEGAP